MGCLMPRYRVTVTCDGLTSDEGRLASLSVLGEFGQRPWHQCASCTWDGKLLWFVADNDYDATGKALLDEFGDALIATLNMNGTINLEIRSVVQIGD